MPDDLEAKTQKENEATEDSHVGFELDTVKSLRKSWLFTARPVDCEHGNKKLPPVQ